MGETPEALLEFWFGDALVSEEEAERRAALWFSANEAFDREIARRFGALPERAARGELDAWRGQAASSLALVLALDQLPRNLYRGSARAFAFDASACAVALESLERGFDRELHPLQASFFYLPLEHAEDLGLQERCVSLFEALAARSPAAERRRIEEFAAFAVRHRDVVRRFGRFPHRNRLLGRETTEEERAWLDAGGDTFAG